jgi:hypothetical protein
MSDKSFQMGRCAICGRVFQYSLDDPTTIVNCAGGDITSALRIGGYCFKCIAPFCAEHVNVCKAFNTTQEAKRVLLAQTGVTEEALAKAIDLQVVVNCSMRRACPRCGNTLNH